MRERLLYLSDEHAARVRSRVRTLRARSTASTRPAQGATSSLTSRRPPVVNRMTTSWCIVPAPTRSWADLVYPELDREDAFVKLWEDVAHICRLDADDPAQAWAERSSELKADAQRLTERRYDAVRLHGPGTDVTIGLLPSSHWAAGDLQTVDGRRHSPNLPTEELFTTPDPGESTGASRDDAARALGSIITGIRVEFEGGRAVKIDADTTRTHSARTPRRRDAGASRLGEVALVDGGGRIGPLGRVFYDTLIDENAATHIALGDGYDHPVEDAADKTRVNKSKVHIDFMIGSLSSTSTGSRGRPRRAGSPRRCLADLGRARLATSSRRSRSSAASSPRSSRRGSAARLSSPKTRSKSGVVR